jgi:peptidoglycan/LPS O-acetylase OafA/YrhL
VFSARSRNLDGSNSQKEDLTVKLLSSGRYAHIDAMRALAVMLVVVSHAGLGDIVPGGSGVTIFFGISGFIITYLLLKERNRTDAFDIGAFYERRALKILPPLFVIIVIPTLIIGLLSSIEWKPLLGIIFFYFNWLFLHGAQPQLTGSAVVWSLSIEEQFYLTFAFIWFLMLRFKVHMRWLAVATLGVAAASIALRIVFVTGKPATSALEDRIYFGTDTRIDAIAFGVATAICFFYYGSESMRRSANFNIVKFCQKDAVLIAAVFMFLLSLVYRNEWFRYTFRFSIQALVACVIILYGFGTSSSPVRRMFNFVVSRKTVQLIGLASYSIYLAHLVVMSPAMPYLDGVGNVLRWCVLVLIGTCAGIVSYLVIERPIQQWRTRKHVAVAAE